MYNSIKDKDLIKRAAHETSYYHKPNFYKSYIKEHFNRDVSASHIVKTLGTFRNRIKRLDYQIALKVIEILDMANNDISHHKWIVDQYFTRNLNIVKTNDFKGGL